MVSKTATSFLIIHALTHLWTAGITQAFDQTLTTAYPAFILNLFVLTAHIALGVATFLPLSILNHCCVPKRSRVTLQRHLLTAILFAPILAQVTGRWLGMIEGRGQSAKVMGASACYEQLDLRDVDVIAKSAWCAKYFGYKQHQVDIRMRARRGRTEYVEYLAEVCVKGLLQIGQRERVCWMGLDDGEERGVREWESVNGERMQVRRLFEECHRKFGVEVRLKWTEGGDAIPRLKLPDVGGVKGSGEWIEPPVDMVEDSKKGIEFEKKMEELKLKKHVKV
ncbi:hypothetical protein BJ875DRAFT_222684 [Amylocarpus encephaloides]|uniref:Uncharacterized protein n=1 Tax=Amylocarpus encephaloides TaxID=45428 RepID=A0A9P7YNX4_9HELO|nr:hypothetical protein BJ875DRAFT_222684 [Amylocarpus encephaloides]